MAENTATDTVNDDDLADEALDRTTPTKLSHCAFGCSKSCT